MSEEVKTNKAPKKRVYLTLAQIREIKRMAGEKSTAELAATYGVSAASIRNAINRPLKSRMKFARQEIASTETVAATRSGKRDTDAIFDLLADLVCQRIEGRMLGKFRQAFGG